MANTRTLLNKNDWKIHFHCFFNPLHAELFPGNCTVMLDTFRKIANVLIRKFQTPVSSGKKFVNLKLKYMKVVRK